MTAAWTWLIYMATHNDVAQAGERSIARMRMAPLDERVHVLVHQDTPERSTRRVLGADREQVNDIEAHDSGDPAALLDFVRWGMATAPAERYALVLWSHGTGWQPSELARLAPVDAGGQPVDLDEARERSGTPQGRQIFFATTMRRLLAKSSRQERAVAFDDGSGHSLDTIELGDIMRQIHADLGHRLDLLVFNACQMSSIEVVYQVRQDVDVFIASQEDMPVESLPYDDIFTRLVSAPKMEPADLGRLLVERYCTYFKVNPLRWGSDGLPQGVTLAAVKASEVVQLADTLKTLTEALQNGIAGKRQLIWNAHRKALAFKLLLYDLGGFCRGLVDQPALDATTVAAANLALARLENPAVMLANQHLGAAYTGVGGLTTYLVPPMPGASISPHYAETAYAQATGWDQFLVGYHRGGQSGRR